MTVTANKQQSSNKTRVTAAFYLHPQERSPRAIGITLWDSRCLRLGSLLLRYLVLNAWAFFSLVLPGTVIDSDGKQDSKYTGVKVAYTGHFSSSEGMSRE